MTFPTFHYRTFSFCPVPIISSLEPSKKTEKQIHNLANHKATETHTIY